MRSVTLLLMLIAIAGCGADERIGSIKRGSISISRSSITAHITAILPTSHKLAPVDEALLKKTASLFKDPDQSLLTEEEMSFLERELENKATIVANEVAQEGVLKALEIQRDRVRSSIKVANWANENPRPDGKKENTDKEERMLQQLEIDIKATREKLMEIRALPAYSDEALNIFKKIKDSQN